MDLSSVKIETERLFIVPVSMKYAKDINAGLDEEVTRYMPIKPTSLAATKAWINEKLEGKELVVVILNKNTGEFIGGGGVHDIASGNPELGIWIKQSSWGHHYGCEVVVALKVWADENIEYKYLLYPVDVNNIPSRKIAENLGGVQTREYVDKNILGEDMNLIEYRIYRNNNEFR